MGLKNMRVAAQLGMGFGLVLLLALIIGIAGYWGIRSLSGITTRMLQTDARISAHAARARAKVLGLRRYEKDIFLNIGNTEKVEGYSKN